MAAMAGESPSLVATAIRSIWWGCSEAHARLSGAWSTFVALVERSLPSWLFLTVQTIFVVTLTVVLFVLAVCVAWVLLWKLVLSKIRFVVALKNELLLGQPSRPTHSRRRSRRAE
jgi:hypothetical protein